MKTAVSIPNDVYDSAEKLVRQLGTSRSKLYTQALKSYLKKRRGAAITRRLNEVYKDVDSSLDPVIRELQARSLPTEKW